MLRFIVGTLVCFSLGSVHGISQDSLGCSSGEIKTTVSGHIFTCDNSHPKLGEAWRDESGMIWGELVKDDQGNPKKMSHRGADGYCKSIGAALPSGYPENLNGMDGFPNHDSDYTRLRKYLGAWPIPLYENPWRYKAEVLAGLEASKYHWSSSVVTFFADAAYVFYGKDGNFFINSRKYDVCFRCVVSVHQRL